MAWKGIVRSEGWTVDQAREEIAKVQFTDWRPSGLTLHNTGAPNLSQWSGYPEKQRIENLERYYRDEQGWSAGPHFFVDDDDPCIWPFTPINIRGVHSPSFNATRIGVEMVGDYRPGVDDPMTGRGLIVYKNMVALFAILCDKLGLEPTSETIKFHREDPRTTHQCPGDLMWRLKSKFIEDVSDYMSVGGDHPVTEDELNPPTLPPWSRVPREGVVDAQSGLNLREGAGISTRVIRVLPRGLRVAILRETMNGPTKWYRVWYRDEDGVAHAGWVSARYVSSQ